MGEYLGRMFLHQSGAPQSVVREVVRWESSAELPAFTDLLPAAEQIVFVTSSGARVDG